MTALKRQITFLISATYVGIVFSGDVSQNMGIVTLIHTSIILTCHRPTWISVGPKHRTLGIKVASTVYRLLVTERHITCLTLHSTTLVAVVVGQVTVLTIQTVYPSAHDHV